MHINKPVLNYIWSCLNLNQNTSMALGEVTSNVVYDWHMYYVCMVNALDTSYARCIICTVYHM